MYTILCSVGQLYEDDSVTDKTQLNRRHNMSTSLLIDDAALREAETKYVDQIQTSKDFISLGRYVELGAPSFDSFLTCGVPVMLNFI